MSSYRSKSRELALQILYGLNFNDYNESCENYIDIFKEEFRENDEDIDVKFLNKKYCEEILNGITSNQVKIDNLIQQHLKRWKVERLPKIDLSILRLATYEMCFKNLDPKIAINEAINLSKKFCGDKASAYINGVLNSIKDVKLEG